MTRNETKQYIIAILVSITIAIVAIFILSHTTNATSNPTVADAKAYALHRLGPTQYTCLDQIATRESHWNPRAHNPTTGAHGIFQAYPARKMAKYGKDYLTNPITQTRFGIAYTKTRYGSPCNAWAYWKLHGWY